MISIKPHHFVDILRDLGAGRADYQPHPFNHALHTVARAILVDPDVLLRLEFGADDICGPCIHNIGGLCDDTIDTSFRPTAPSSKREYNLLIDRRWCRQLGLADGDVLSARQLALRIRECLLSMPEIYIENQPDNTAARQADVARGITTFLATKSAAGLGH